MLYEVEVDVSIETLVFVCLTVYPAHVCCAKGTIPASVEQRSIAASGPLIINCFIKIDMF